MRTLSLESQLASFIGKYTLEVAEQVQGARAKLRGIFPRGYELVYDNFNALVFAFGPTQQSSDAVLSIAAYPRWVSLFFLQGAKLADPHGMLKGSGSKVRHLVLSSPEDLDAPAIRELMSQAVRPVAAAFASAPQLSTVVKSVSPKQRPRRPSESAAKPIRAGKSAKARLWE